MALFKMGAFADTLRGKSGNSVFSKTKSGIVVRDLVIPTNPQTPAQQGIRNKFRAGSQTWTTLTANQVANWNKYAATLTMRSKGGKLRKKRGIDVFTGLATKFLQVSPNGSIPLTPPTSAFTGDTITLTVSSETPGELLFEASGGNAAGVTTEILLQPLANANRKPQPGAFRTEQFHVFTTGAGQSLTVNVPAGYYAAAYRFVRIATGQDSLLQFLPVTTVALSLADGGWSEESSSAKPAKAMKKAA